MRFYLLCNRNSKIKFQKASCSLNTFYDGNYKPNTFYNGNRA